ncbi:MAG: SDR family oxidoreductase [Thermotogaceae bacterium]|nr:SDR family oxidoreductase [Thermotogaceae bacterium]
MRCVVTGANRGIGYAIAKNLLSQGHSVIAGVRNPEADSLKELKRLYDASFEVYKLDLADEASIKEFSGNIEDPVDILFNNAGVLYRDSAETVEYEKVLYTIKVNTLGALFLTKYLIKNLTESGNPKVINTSSILGSISSFSGTTSVSYSVSKAALNMVTVSMANDLRKYNIIVISLHPGWVRTDMGGSAAPVLPDESAKGIINLAMGLTMKQSGRFFDYEGREIPW